jgi:type IV pilus assembly protein PilB
MSLAVVEPKPDVAPPAMPRLGERLLSAGLISREELSTALQEQLSRGSRIGEVLTEMGLIQEQELVPLLAEQLDLPGVRLRDGMIDPTAVRLIPRNIAERYALLAMFKVRQELTVAMADPRDLDAIDRIERTTGLTVRPVLAVRSNILKLLPRCYDQEFSIDEMTAGVDMDSMEAVEVHTEAIDLDSLRLDQLGENSPAVSMVNFAIIQAIRQGASDIHIEAGPRHTCVRFRVDGVLREVLRPRRELHPAIVSRIKVMAKLDIAEHRLPQDGRIHIRLERREIDLRVSTLPTIVGEKVVLRVLDKQRVSFDLRKLGFENKSLVDTLRMLNRPHGLFIVCGPTGSGKTTTLYSAIEHLKGPQRNVVTVEDPVEYQLEMINQVPVGSEHGLTFATALRSILRQDPDVILVGEIRDRETAEIAVQAALTGHLVLSTLHTNDAAGAITRLQDMGIEQFKIAASLVGIVAQRLLRTVCPHCRTAHYPSAQLLQELRYRGDQRRAFIRGTGCVKCFDTGFQGRAGIYEILEITPEIRELLGQGEGADGVRRAHRRAGGQSLLDEGIRLAEGELTSLEEVGRVALFD